MGTFLSTTYIQCSDADRDNLTDQLRARITQFMQGHGYRVVVSSSDATRTVGICRAPAGSWLAVLNQVDDLLAQDSLDAQVLSNGLEQYVVDMQLHDSDVLHLTLCRQGEALDRFVSIPDYYGEVSKSERAAVKGKPEVWQPVLEPDATPAQLKKAWSGKHVFAEENWTAVAALFGIDKRMAYLHEHMLLDELPATDVKLHFAKDQTDLRNVGTEEAPLRFSLSGGGDHWTALDTPLNLRFTVSANREAQDDIIVAVWGDALSDGHIKDVGVSLSILEIVSGQAANAVTESAVELMQFEAHVEGSNDVFTAHGGRVARFVIPTFGLPSMTQRPVTRVCVLTVTGQPTRIGSSVLNVYTAPSSASQTGAAIAACKLAVRDLRQERTDLGWVPLRAREPAEVYERERWMQGVRRLAEASQLVAMVVFAGGESRFRIMLPELLGNWVAALRLRPSQMLRGTLWQENGSSQMIRVRKSSVPTGRSWAKLASLAALAKDFTIDAGSIADASEGAYLNSHAQFREKIGWLSPAAHTLFLTYDIEGVGVEGRQQRASQLREVIERLVSLTSVVQATLAYWPRMNSIHRTPYEDVIAYQTPWDANWCQTYLRTLAPEMWLGPELLARLDANTDFGEVAERQTTSRGGVYLRLHDGLTLADIERHLTPLLATIEDNWGWLKGGVASSAVASSDRPIDTPPQI